MDPGEVAGAVLVAMAAAMGAVTVGVMAVTSKNPEISSPEGVAVAAAREKARRVVSMMVAKENGKGEVVDAGEVAAVALVEVGAPLLTVAAMEAARAEAAQTTDMEAQTTDMDVVAMEAAGAVEAVTAPRAVVFGCRLTCSEGQIFPPASAYAVFLLGVGGKARLRWPALP